MDAHSDRWLSFNSFLDRFVLFILEDDKVLAIESEQKLSLLMLFGLCIEVLQDFTPVHMHDQG